MPEAVIVDVVRLASGKGKPGGALSETKPVELLAHVLRSLVERNGTVVGSALIGQPFAGAVYLHPRPSAAGDGYDGSASSGSNYGPLNEDLKTRVAEGAMAIRAQNGVGAIPADAVTASASGLDPDISPEYARLQARRIATARGASVQEVQAVIDQQAEGALLGFIGQPHVNVLVTNRALDARFPIPAP